MLPAMGVTAGVSVADRAWSHGPIVQHNIGRDTICAPEEHVPSLHVKIPVVADDGRLARTRAPLASGSAVLRGDERGDLDAPDHPAAAAVQGVMVDVPGDEHAIPFPDRVLLPITDQHSGPFEYVDFMLPGMDVVRTGLAGLDHRVNWLQVFRRADASRIGECGRP